MHMVMLEIKHSNKHLFCVLSMSVSNENITFSTLC